tara:strand:+ start:9 stop:572 length:564 start_codon:yes stop_codon:yes gene_type:complete
MKRIGITGSLASGKTTASKILSARKGPLFSADLIVKKLYLTKSFKDLLKKKFEFSSNVNLKNELKKKIFNNKSLIKKLENIIHPLVRKEMRKFTTRHKSKPYCFYEIPLLIESKLMKNFDIIIFIKSNKKIRLKRFVNKGGTKNLFKVLNNRQLIDRKKMKYCDYIVVNDKNKKILKENLRSILKKI